MAQTTAGAGDTPAKLFSGYDSVSRGMLSSSAVTGGYEQTGGRSTVHIQVCESVSDLAQALEIDGSLSVSYLKALNVTAKMSFMKKLNVTARSITIVVYASHETGTWSVKDIALKAGVNGPASEEAAADFVQAYGDSYVSAATQGGEYYAVYTFRTETQSEQSSLTSSLKAKGIYSGVTAKLDLQMKLSDFLSKTTVNWRFDQEITGIANPTLPDQDKLIEFALAFPSKPLDSPVTTGFKVIGYERVPGFGRHFKKVTANRRHFLGDDGVLQRLARLRGIQNQVAWLKAIYARYDYRGDTALLAFERQVKDDLGVINDQIDAWDDDPTGDFDKPHLPSLDKGEPVLAFSVGQPPSYGGEGGSPFDFMKVGEALRNQVKICSLRLADGDNVIRRLEVGYSSDKANWTTIHGEGGNTKDILFLEDGQFPARFEVRYGSLVDRLAFHLNDGRMTWAGGEGGASTEWRVPDGSVVLGFAGRSAAKLDQIKIIHAALKPAEYVQAIRAR